MSILWGIGMFYFVMNVVSVGGEVQTQDPATESFRPLSYEEMTASIGGSGCKDCQWIPMQMSECYHESPFDTCGKNKCLVNLLVEETCIPGTGDCEAAKNANAITLWQDVRADSNCSTFLPTGSLLWATHYYGSDCRTTNHYIRCIKSSACNGTLIQSHPYPNGIMCLQ